MTVEPRNAASDKWRGIVQRMSDRAWVRTAIRELLAKDFVREDRQGLIVLPPLDSESYIDAFDAYFEMGDGRPMFTFEEVVAIRGDRLTLCRIRLEYASGERGEKFHILQFDRQDDLIERIVTFDVDDGDAAIIELDHLHDVIEAAST